MNVFFQRIDPRTHRFFVERAPFSAIDETLETRSFLPHDFAHLALELTLKTNDGFFGLLAAGHSLASLRQPDGEGTVIHRKLMQIERQVTRLQSAFKSRTSNDKRPAIQMLSALHGTWRKTRQGQALQLGWPDGTIEVAPDGIDGTNCNL